MQDRYRLKKGSDFRRVYAARRRRDGGLLILYSRPNQLPNSRVGFSVSTKVGGAVVRNVVKRRLREVCRGWLEAGRAEAVDVVVVARPEAATAGFEVLSGELLGLLASVPPGPLGDAGGPVGGTRL